MKASKKAPVIFLFLPMLLFAQNTTVQEPTLVFTHVTVIDATGSPARSDMTLLVTGERIAAVGKTNGTPIPKGARIVNAAGKFLIPGLWDMHVHIFNQASRRAPNTWYFPLLIANGVTSVREMWTKPQDMNQVREWRRRSLEGVVPRIAAVGTLVDGQPPVWPHSDTVTSPEEAARMVRRIKAAGVDFVKTYSSLSREAYLAIAHEASKQDIPFAGHVPAAIGADEASDAGQKSMEHFNQVLETCSTKERELLRIPPKDWSTANDKVMLDTFDQAKCGKLFSLLANNDTWQVPTLIRTRVEYFAGDPENFIRSPRLKYVPIGERNRWKAYVAEQRKLSESERNVKRRVWRAQISLVRPMHEAGVNFMAGTDLGNDYIYPGFSLHDELALLVEAGLSPIEALQAGTRNPARFLGMIEQVGTIEEGKFADLVLLDGNPLEEIRNTRRIDAVVLNGRFLPKESLQRMLAQARAFANGQIDD